MSAQSKPMDTGEQLRILLLSHEWPPLGGGAGAVCQSLCHELATQGHHLDVVTTGYKALPAMIRENGVSVHRLSCLRRCPDRPRHFELALYVIRAIGYGSRLLRSGKYDLIHGNCILPAGLAAYWLHRRYGVPYTLTASGTDVPGHNPGRFSLEHKLLFPVWQRVVANGAAVVSPSSHLAQRIAQHFGCGIRTINTIPNGIDLSAIKPQAESGQKRILAVGRILESKGYQYLVEAMVGLDCDYGLEIVGDGPYRPHLEQKAKDLGVAAEFHGWVDRANGRLKTLYETSTIFVHPSAVENFPTVILEAMAAGLPIITTHGTGCEEVGGDAVLLTAPGDVGALRGALMKVMEDDLLRHELGRRARERVVKQFSWESVSARYLGMWRDARSTGES